MRSNCPGLAAALVAAFLWLLAAPPVGAVASLSGRLADATVRVVVTGVAGRKFHGAGVLISPRYVLTARHVASSGPRLAVEYRSGGTDAAILVWQSKKYDLAVLDLGLRSRRKPIAVDCRKPRYMEMLVAVGHGGSLGRWTATTGFVSSARLAKRPGEFIASMNSLPGFSGGPVADARGRVIGILTGLYVVRLYRLYVVGGFSVVVSAGAFCNELRAAGYLPAGPRAGGAK